MNRRTALASLGTLVGIPVAAALAQTSVPRIVFFTYYSGRATDPRETAFREGLKDLGWRDGGNVAIERRAVDHEPGQLSRESTERVAVDLVATRPTIIVAQGYAIAAAAKVTKTIPVVGAYSGDMVDGGAAKSLAQPGGNVTGVQVMATELFGKRVELLKELLPNLRHMAVVAHEQHPGEPREREATIQTAQRLGIKVSYYPVRTSAEFDAALPAAHAAGAKALLLFPDSISQARVAGAAQFALQHAMATASGWDIYVEEGCLVSYGPNLQVCFRRLAYYVDRILKGASPATLPVELPSVFETVLNLKTARALGIKVPQSILARVDRVIE